MKKILGVLLMAPMVLLSGYVIVKLVIMWPIIPFTIMLTVLFVVGSTLYDYE